MTIREFNIDNANFKFVNSSRNTRHGFAHDTTLFINNNEITAESAFYLNRTWETYRYQTVMLNAVYNLKKDRAAAIKAAYKVDNGLRAVRSQAQKNALQALIDNDYYIRLYNSAAAILRAF